MGALRGTKKKAPPRDDAVEQAAHADATGSAGKAVHPLGTARPAVGRVWPLGRWRDRADSSAPSSPAVEVLAAPGSRG